MNFKNDSDKKLIINIIISKDISIINIFIEEINNVFE